MRAGHRECRQGEDERLVMSMSEKCAFCEVDFSDERADRRKSPAEDVEALLARDHTYGPLRELLERAGESRGLCRYCFCRMGRGAALHELIHLMKFAMLAGVGAADWNEEVLLGGDAAHRKDVGEMLEASEALTEILRRSHYRLARSRMLAGGEDEAVRAVWSGE